MAEDDIQFGEVEVVRPARRRRPDVDRHFAIMPYGQPADEDLPIFLDMDVLRDMEAHARSDRSVELGGILLGGQFEDDDGRPFVLISDNLRAKHYESSRGHFKFTHDTWSELHREQQTFNADTKIVGWYHTHPGWGVFLSGMDLFICDHFFNRPLDVALVIDPVNLDRGFFYWNQQGGERLPRTKGFWVTSTTHRRQELEGYVYTLQGTAPRRTREDDVSDWPEAVAGSSGWGGRHAPPPPPMPGGPLLWYVLGLQTALLVLVLWQLSSGGAGGAGRGGFADDTTASRAALAKMHQDAKLEVLDEVVKSVAGGPTKVASDLAEEKEKREDLKRQVDRLAEALELRENDKARLELDIIQLRRKNQELLAKIPAPPDSAAGPAAGSGKLPDLGSISDWAKENWIALAALFGLIGTAGIGALVMRRMAEPRGPLPPPPDVPAS